MDTNLERLLELVRKVPAGKIDEAVELVRKLVIEEDPGGEVFPCPHCKSVKTRRNGVLRGKQRYHCKECGRTFGATTGTAMYYSHIKKEDWEQAIRDTVNGESLDATAEKLRVSHNTAFNVRHKILSALEGASEMEPQALKGVCEVDDTYVLESSKGTKIPEGYYRGARKHGAKAVKRGVSSEYISICAAIERCGISYAKAVNRATPTKENISEAFAGHIEPKTLVLCDGAKAFRVLSDKCEVVPKEDFREINSINGFHSFIKERYRRYRGVATKYLNRYNALFSLVYRATGDAVADASKLICAQKGLFRKVEALKTLSLLCI